MKAGFGIPTATMIRKTAVRAGHLGDGDGLLFHDLVDGGAVRVGHLVELVNAADTLIRQHQGPPFQGHFSSQRISHHSSRETNTGGTTTGGVLA